MLWVLNVIFLQCLFLLRASWEGNSLWIYTSLLQILAAVAAYLLAVFSLPLLLAAVMFRPLWDRFRLRPRDLSNAYT